MGPVSKMGFQFLLALIALILCYSTLICAAPETVGDAAGTTKFQNRLHTGNLKINQLKSSFISRKLGSTPTFRKTEKFYWILPRVVVLRFINKF